MHHALPGLRKVQGQLAISILPWCDFVVYLSDSREMAIIRVDFDEIYWQSLVGKVECFLLNWIVLVTFCHEVKEYGSNYVSKDP